MKAISIIIHLSNVYLCRVCSGYMSPEYANGGNFSIKSDVFSFGVLMLEIISGKKNSVCYQNEVDFSLLEQVRI